MLQIPKEVFRRIRHHAEEAYPNECCGILLGTADPERNERKQITDAVPTPNISPNPARHYEIAPIDLIRIERKARSGGYQRGREGCREIVGFYHSHPDHPAQWSATDLVEAHWFGCSYVITEVRNGTALLTRSYHLAGSGEAEKRFEEEEIQMLETLSASL